MSTSKAVLPDLNVDKTNVDILERWQEVARVFSGAFYDHDLMLGANSAAMGAANGDTQISALCIPTASQP